MISSGLQEAADGLAIPSGVRMDQAQDAGGWRQIARGGTGRDPVGRRAMMRVSILVVVAALCAGPGQGLAQGSYPNRPITMVVPLPAHDMSTE